VLEDGQRLQQAAMGSLRPCVVQMHASPLVERPRLRKGI
jgi:hypothetical protein